MTLPIKYTQSLSCFTGTVEPIFMHTTIEKI